MTIYTKISNYFQNLFGNDKETFVPQCTEMGYGMNSIYTPSLTQPPTSSYLTFAKNINIFEPNFNFNTNIHFNNNNIFNFPSTNFDMFNYNGLDGVSLTSQKTEKDTYSLDFWKEQGYNEEKGVALAKKAKSNVLSKSHTQCTLYVRKAINKAFKTHYTAFGNNAWEVGKNILANDKNFKKIDVDMSKIQPEDIPAGAIVIYPSRGYSNHKAGHIEISDGEGHGLSDFKSKSLCQNRGNRRNPAEIWIPV